MSIATVDDCGNQVVLWHWCHSVQREVGAALSATHRVEEGEEDKSLVVEGHLTQRREVSSLAEWKAGQLPGRRIAGSHEVDITAVN